MQIDLLMKGGKYTRALEESQMLYERAKNEGSIEGMGVTTLTLSRLSRAQEKFDDAVKYGKEAIGYLKRTDNRRQLWQAYWELCGMITRTGDHEDAINTLLEWEKLIREIYPDIQSTPEVQKKWWQMWSAAAADAYTYAGDFKLAEKYIRQTEELTIDRKGLNDRMMINGLWINYYEEKKDYANALALLDTAFPAFILNANKESHVQHLLESAELAEKLKAFERASGYYRHAYLLADTLAKEQHEVALDSLRTEFEVDRLELESARNEAYWKLALVICIFLTISLFCYMVYLRRLRLQNKLLVQQIATARLGLLPKTPSIQTDAMPGIDPDDGLNRLRELLSDKTILASPTLNRETLAKQMGTNETYLREKIRNHFGVSVNEYITGLRLGYACELIVAGEIPLKDIASMTGLGSTATFYRLFRKYFECSPGDYQKNWMNN
jgi:AraC-like DNA-binding protein